MGDGKNDGKRKKPENCRWENRRKNEKTRKLSMGKTTENEKNQKTADGTFDGKQKKKEETKTKNVYLFNWPFAGNRKKQKKATTSLPANVCSFLVLTKMKKRKTFAFAC